MLASEAFDVEWEDPPGWAGGVAQERRSYVCDAAKNALAAQGPDALVRAARAYATLPDLGRDAVLQLLENAPLDRWEKLDEAERTAIVDGLAGAPQDHLERLRWRHSALRAASAHDDAALAHLIFEAWHGEPWMKKFGSLFLPKLTNREPLRRAILGELLDPPGRLAERPVSFRALGAELSQVELDALQARFRNPISEAHEAALAAALAPALEAGRLDDATRTHLLRRMAQACAASDNRDLWNRAIARFGSAALAPELRPLVEPQLASRDANVVAAAVERLAYFKLANAADVTRLVELLNPQVRRSTRTTVITILGELGPVAAPAKAALLSVSGEWHRDRGLKSLGEHATRALDKIG